MFRTEALRQRIELINHLIEFGRQIILIQGATGFGKTTLVDALEETAEPGWVIIRFKAGPTLNRESLLEKISANLDFEPTERFSEEQVCDEIHRRLEILDKSNQLVVVVIDDAHELPSDTHSLLLALAHNDDAAAEIRVVLAADNSDSSLLDHLQAGAIEEALIHRVDIPRMDREQTASLLSWWQDQQHDAPKNDRDERFSSAIIDEIYAHSEGVPGNIVVLARQYRLRGNNTQLRADPVKKYLILGGLGLLAVTLFGFFGKDVGDHEPQELKVELPDSVVAVVDEPQLVTLPATEPNQLTPLTDEYSAVQPAAQADDQADDQADKLLNGQASSAPDQQRSEPANKLDQRLPSQPNSTPPPLVSEGMLEDMLTNALFDEVAHGATSETLASEDTPNDTPDAETSAPARAEINSPIKQPAADDKRRIAAPASKTDAAEKPTPAATPKVSVKLREQSPTASTRESLKSAPAPQPTSPKPAVSKPAKSPYSLAKLLRESPNGYVLQLIGVREHDAASKYIDLHSITDKSTVVASLHRGEPWFVVIYGQFDSREEAVAGAGLVAKSLPNVKPWPRPISSLK